MQIGMGRLKWSPAEFWKATPADLRRACEGDSGQFDKGGLGMTRKEFEALKVKLEAAADGC